jgi:MYXO-CTERM domain-containing protein
MYVRSENNSPDYYPNRFLADPLSTNTGSFQLQWDVKVTSCDWSAEIGFGIYDGNLKGGGVGVTPYQCMDIELSVDDGGNSLVFRGDDAASDWHVLGVAHWSFNQWYTCKIVYDAVANTVHYEAKNRGTGEVVGSYDVSGPSGGFKAGWAYIGTSRNGLGDGGYGGMDQWAVAEGSIDNARLTTDYDWQTITDDFSTDPCWPTDQPANHHWDGITQTIYVRAENNSPNYHPNRFYATPIAKHLGTFALQWGVKVTSCDWSAGLPFGIYDNNLRGGGVGGASYQCMDIILDVDDGGNSLVFWGEDTASGWHVSDHTHWSLNQWYTCKILYDAVANTVHYEAKNRDTGELVGSYDVSGPSGGFKAGWAYIGTSRNGLAFGPEAAEGNIDNVVVSRLRTLALTVVKSQYGEVTVDPNLPGGYEPNASVVLRAMPKQGRGFKGWSGDVPSGHQFDNPLTITMNSPKEIMATFDCGVGMGPMLPLMAVGLLGLVVVRRRRK